MLNDLSRPSKQTETNNDQAGDKLVKCKGCLKTACQKKSLKKHFKRHHQELYKGNEDKKRKWFIASATQTIPEDPDYQLKSSKEHSSPKSIEDTCSVKRQKTEESKSEAHRVEFS